MATFVLVPGSWHGGWCWRKITPLLRAAGHEVYTPTLTGLGERSHLASPAINLDTHIVDVVNVLEYEDLHDVVLVGHSYGTMVVTGAADRLPERVAWLVLLDGSIPEPGKALLDLIPAERRAMIEERSRREGDGWRMPTPPPGEWGVTDPDDVAWMTPRLTPHLLKTVQQPLIVTGAVDRIPHAYISCTARPPGNYIERSAQRARDQGWRYFELPCGHDAMVLLPRELADALLSLV